MTFSFRPARMALTIALLTGVASGAFAQDNKPADPAAPAAAATPVAPAPDTVVATVEGVNVTQADLDLAISNLDQQIARMPEEQRRAAALSAIIEMKLMAKEARAKGFDNDPEHIRRMGFLQDRSLHMMVFEKEVGANVTDEQVRARYDKEIAAQPPVNEVKARHILVKTKEEADAVIKELESGKSFEEVANEKTTDPSGKGSGGDLGYFSAGQMVPEFEKAAFALNPGEYTKEPVKSQFGYHVIKVEDKRQQPPPAFDTVKEQVRGMLQREQYIDFARKLRAEAKVEITDPALKAAVEAMEAPKPEEGAEPAADQPAAQ